MAEPVYPGIYQHYKGPHYFVIAVGRLHDTQHDIVVYASSKVSGDGKVLLRDYDDFIREVEWPDGVMRPRFVREYPE